MNYAPREIRDGGSAFPIEGRVEAHYRREPGMTLRDYFAAKAMHAQLCAEYTNRQGVEPDRAPLYDLNDPEQTTTVAHLAYEMADAMLKARGSDQ